MANVPIRIYHNHGSAYWGTSWILKSVFWVIERLNCGFATHVLFVNPLLAKAFIRARIVSPGKVLTFEPGSACGIDLSAYPEEAPGEGDTQGYRQYLGVPKRHFVVLYVGRPNRRKGFHFLLHTWANSPFSSGDNTLLIAGCTDDDVRHVLGHIVPSNIVVLGNQMDLVPIYACSDVVVLPSHHEGMSYALLEAAACARPLVVTDIPGNRAFWSEEMGVLFHPVDDGRKFVDCLESLKADPGLRRLLGARARTSAERFDRKHVLGNLTAFYRSHVQHKY